MPCRNHRNLLTPKKPRAERSAGQNWRARAGGKNQARQIIEPDQRRIVRLKGTGRRVAPPAVIVATLYYCSTLKPSFPSNEGARESNSATRLAASPTLLFVIGAAFASARQATIQPMFLSANALLTACARPERRRGGRYWTLAAILAADVVGFSRLAGADEGQHFGEASCAAQRPSRGSPSATVAWSSARATG